MYDLRYNIILLIAIIFCASAFKTDAAVLTAVPDEKQFNIGQNFSLDVVINSEDDFINAADVSLTFPIDVLEAVSIDKVGSAFNFWVEEPVFSNNEGTVRLIGGTAKGVSGDSLKVVTINFKTKGAGSADIEFADAVVTAADGKGTNVLSSVEGANVGVGTRVVAPQPATIPVTSEEILKPQLEEPVKVERASVKAINLPDAPVVRVQLYPDEERWYNQIGDVIVLWDLPDDIVQVSTRLSRSKDKKSGDKDQDLYTGKNLGPLSEEGEWFVRVQFRNNIGWGELTYYRIGLDTTPPLPFKIDIDAQVSDNPSPTLAFGANDELSGIAGYELFVDGKRVLETASSTAKLPPQAPGTHILEIQAIDKAGNKINDEVEFEVVPLPTPSIEFISSAPRGEPVFVFGLTAPNSLVDIELINPATGVSVSQHVANSDQGGSWKLSVPDLVQGKYIAVARARDHRGAVSYKTEPTPFRVTAPIVLSTRLGDFGWLEIIIFIFVFGGSGIAYTVLYTRKQKADKQAYSVIAGRDVDKMGTLLETELSELERSLKSKQSDDASEYTQSPDVQFRIKNMRSVIGRMKKYIGKELEQTK